MREYVDWSAFIVPAAWSVGFYWGWTIVDNWLAKRQSHRERHAAQLRDVTPKV